MMYKNMVIVVPEAFSWICSVKKLCEKSGRIHGETPVIESSNVVGKCEPCFFSKSIVLRCFIVNFSKFVRAAIL